MNTHVPLGLWIAVPAGVAITYLAVIIGLGRKATGSGRGRTIYALTAWPAAFTVLAAAGAFATSYHQKVPVIAFGIAVPVVAAVVFYRRSPALRSLLDSIPMRALIGVQLYRVIGGLFILAWALGRMPAIFALPAGIGDVLVGLEATYVARRIGDGTARSRRLAVWWNIAGITDLVFAVFFGASTSPSGIYSPLLGHANPLISRLPFVLIPVFLVPVSVLLHFVALRRLREPAGEPARTLWPRVPADAVGPAGAR